MKGLKDTFLRVRLFRRGKLEESGTDETGWRGEVTGQSQHAASMSEILHLQRTERVFGSIARLEVDVVVQVGPMPFDTR